MSTVSDKSVVVIGAGIVGVCCALHLHKAGYQVTVIDSAMPGTKTSYGNAGCISPSKIVPFSHPDIIKELPKWLLKPNAPLSVKWRQLVTMWPWLKQFWSSGTGEHLAAVTESIANLMALANRDWDTLIAATKAERFIQKQGAIKLFNSPEQIQNHQWELDLMREYGYDWQELSGMKLQSMEPDLKVTDSMRGLFFPSWQHVVDPGGLTRHIAEYLEQSGVAFVQDRVQDIKIDTQQQINIYGLSGKSLLTQSCVIAAGIWSNILARQLDYSIPMIPKRGYHAMFASPNVQVNHPILPMADYFIMTPMYIQGQNSLRAAGQAEFDQLDKIPDYQRADLLLKRAQYYFPKLSVESTTHWMGQRPMTPDSLPVISRSPNHPNIFYAFGHGHYGLTQGPTTGRLISSLLKGQTPEIDLNPYRFDRFKT